MRKYYIVLILVSVLVLCLTPISCSRSLRSSIEKSEYCNVESVDTSLNGQGFVFRDQTKLEASLKEYGIVLHPKLATLNTPNKVVILTPMTKVLKLKQLPNLLVVELEPQIDKGYGIAVLTGEIDQPIKFTWVKK